PSFRGDVQKLADMTRRLYDAALEAGRDPASLRRILNVNGVITDNEPKGMFHGPVDQWVEELANLAITYNFDTFILWAEGDDQLARFAEEVMPAVRAQVSAERA
ncbi:MAG TPA: hypothetical protein VK880_05180, partial [Anaerolineales bacterium]|nr:hypothetical protein [Anaerolineales bacterium]